MGLDSQNVLELVSNSLSAEKLRHTIGVADFAGDLARQHGLDPERVRFAALLHDLAKEIPLEQQLVLARRWNLLDYPEDELSPQVLHGPLAAYCLEHQYGVDDQEVLAAIAHHTLGFPGMSCFEMLIYSSDLVEPNRDFPKVDNLRQALYHNIEQGTLVCMEHSLEYLKYSKKQIHPLTILTYEDLQRRLEFGT
ncbi:MAG: bis(5'-nucleosyl)-tetraphosphatase (symmetrical) YqeK [Desulfitobacteriaceae bacterium]|nr:bis(5'-nucleosyl)-tetraphosphatase (symmetrical) YqeK [Desulfitobacteriaceae bacterium]MDD4347202.1 bis(5'-nucleosyl)-tetraphosphatase (symmetrical) YqeK [Desulfitobacteriaceae bacterium]MDD4400388.1 bis(5'-nucleosyl)-tetraphosphatase (symmetrical) YqeK [Desulfitobacteriaceae bacterium]